VSILAACSTPAGGRSHDTTTSSRELEAVRVAPHCAPELATASAVHVARAVAYVTRDGTPLDLDIAWSNARAAAPLVILLHGGSWSGGSRTSLDGEMQALARRGYTAATVEYRLTHAPRNIFPAAAADVRCAVRMLRRRAVEFHIIPSRIAVMGYSAGGHLASLLGVAASAGVLDAGGCEVVDADAAVQAVVSYAGPQDLRVNGPYTREQAEIVTNFLGVFPGDAPDIARLASPIAYVAPGAPPFLMLHGSDDPLVPISHPRRMRDALRAAGTPASLLEIPGAGHGFVGFVTSNDATVRCTVEAFLTRWLGESQGAAPDSRARPILREERP
jgi:acetyl esterase/lipase